MKSRASHSPAAQSLRVLLAGAAVALAAFLPASAAAAPVSASSAGSFVESIGVNTHTLYTNTAYANFPLVEQRLTELGVHHIREDLSTNNPGQYEELNQLAARGIKSDLIMGSPSSGTKTLEELIATVKSKLIGSVEAVEGPNELDLRGVSNWMEQDAAYQQQLYTRIKADPATTSLPVLGPSLGNPASSGSDLSGYLDYGNVHPYPNGQPPESGSGGILARASAMSGSKPVMATETGYHNAVGLTCAVGHCPTSEEAAAVYMPRLFLDYFRHGISRTYAYELVDERSDPGNTDMEAHFGLLRNDFSPKPAFTALQNLISILADPGASSASGSVEFTLGGDTSELQQLLLQKQNGSYYLALWRSSSVWEPSAKVPLPGHTGPVQVVFPGSISGATEYEPNASSQPVRTLAGAGNTLNVEVGPKVVILKLGAIGPPLPVAKTSKANRADEQAQVTAWVSRDTVPVGGRVSVGAKIPAAARSGRVTVERWDGSWKTVAHGRASAKGRFHKTLRITAKPGSKAPRFRVVARRAKPSNPLRVKVLRRNASAPANVAGRQKL